MLHATLSEFRPLVCRVNETQQKYGMDGRRRTEMATRTAGELNGLAVLTINGGERLGRVEDVVVYVQTGRVTGFLVDGGGLFKPARFLPAAEAQSLGADALTVKSVDALVDAPKPLPEGEWLSKTLVGLPVVNEAGTALGKIADIAIDVDTLRVLAFTLSTGLLDNALHGKPHLPLEDVRTVGKDSVVVASTYDPKASPNQSS